MLKVYEWLVYNFMRPHKKFQHFIKWFDICFIRTTTNINKKKKGKIKQREKEKLTSRLGRGPPLQPAQPTRTPLSSSPGWRTHSCVATMPWPPTSPEATSFSPSPSPRVSRLRTAVLIHFPLCSSSSSPPTSDFIEVRELAGAHRRGRRGHRALEVKLLCPSCSPSSTSSSRSKRSRDLDSSRRNRPRALAGSATRRRRILRLRALPNSIDCTVVLCNIPKFSEFWNVNE